MIILNLFGYLPEKIIISQFFNVSIESLSQKYDLEDYEYEGIKKAIEIEQANRAEQFKGTGLALKGAFKSDRQRNQFLYYRILSAYKELLDASSYQLNSQRNYISPMSYILNEITSNLKIVEYRNMKLSDFFGGINERSFDEYFLNLFNLVKTKIRPNNKILNDTVPLIHLLPFIYQSNFLSAMDTEPFRIKHVERYDSMIQKFHDEIELLKIFGKLLDNYFYDSKDANKFIFILRNLPFPSQDDTYSSFLVSISILELFKKSGFRWTEDEKEGISKYFYGSYWTSTQGEVDLIIKIRNKLIHAEYSQYFKLLDKYKELYMNDFEFDRFEATDYQWVLSSIKIKVNEAVANIIWEELNKNNE